MKEIIEKELAKIGLLAEDVTLVRIQVVRAKYLEQIHIKEMPENKNDTKDWLGSIESVMGTVNKGAFILVRIKSGYLRRLRATDYVVALSESMSGIDISTSEKYGEFSRSILDQYPQIFED